MKVANVFLRFAAAKQQRRVVSTFGVLHSSPQAGDSKTRWLATWFLMISALEISVPLGFHGFPRCQSLAKLGLFSKAGASRICGLVFALRAGISVMVCHGAQVPLLELPPSWLQKNWPKWSTCYWIWAASGQGILFSWHLFGQCPCHKHNTDNTSTRMYCLNFIGGLGRFWDSLRFSPRRKWELLPSACCLCTARPLGAQNEVEKKPARDEITTLWNAWGRGRVLQKL